MSNLDTINYIKDQLKITSPKHWYIYNIPKYKAYHHFNNDNTDNRLLVPLNYIFRYRYNLTKLYSKDNLKIETTNSNLFVNN